MNASELISEIESLLIRYNKENMITITSVKSRAKQRNISNEIPGILIFYDTEIRFEK